MKTNNKTLIHALRILARDIQSEDGIANACIAEGADRIEELVEEIETLRTQHNRVPQDEVVK